MKVFQCGVELNHREMEINGKDVDTYCIDYANSIRFFRDDDGNFVFLKVNGNSWNDPEIEIMDIGDPYYMLGKNSVTVHEDNYLDDCVPVGDHFLCPLEHGDVTGLSDEDEASLNHWLEKNDYEFPTDKYGDVETCDITGLKSTCAWVKLKKKI